MGWGGENVFGLLSIQIATQSPFMSVPCFMSLAQFNPVNFIGREQETQVGLALNMSAVKFQPGLEDDDVPPLPR